VSRVLLFECSPRRPSDGVVVPVRLAWKSPGPANHLGQQWEPVVESPPGFVSAIGFDGREFGASPLPQVGELSFALTDRTRSVAGLVWKNAAVVIRSAPWPAGGGNPVAGAFSTVWTGAADSIAAAGGLARVALVDAGQALRAPVLVQKFGSTGIAMLDSADAVRDRPADALVPAAWGRPLGVPATQIDRANGIWLFSGRPATAVAAFYDGGAAFTLGVARASLAALIANTPAAGAVDYCLDASGCFIARPWSPPTFPFTVDATFGGSRAADIASAIVSARGGPAFTAGTVAAFNALQAADCGLYLDDETTIDKALDRIFLGLGAFWRLRAAGTINLRRVGFATPALTVAAHLRGSPERQRIIVPTGRRSLGYARNHKVHSEGDIAAIVQFDDVGGATKPDDNATYGDNLIKDGGLANGTAGWSLPGAFSRVAANAGLSSTWAFQSTTGSGSTPVIGFRVIAGRRLFFSMQVFLAGSARPIGVTLRQRDAANNIIATAFNGGGLVAPGVTTLRQDATLLPNCVAAEVVFEVPVYGGGAVTQITSFRASYTEGGADLTSGAQVVVTVPTTQAYDATFAGVLIGALQPISVRVARGGTSIKIADETTYSITTSPGITATINNTTGSANKGDITPTALTASQATIEVTVTVAGVVQPTQTILFTRTNAPAPSAGGIGAKTATDTSLAQVTGTSFVAVSDVMTVTVASGESIYGTAPVDYQVQGTSVAITSAMDFKWQRSPAGAGTWTDFATAVTGSTSTAPFNTGPPDYEWADGVLGTVTCNQSTSPGAGDYDVRLVAKANTASRTLDLFNTVTVQARV
jgi:hypothetical protein